MKIRFFDIFMLSTLARSKQNERIKEKVLKMREKIQKKVLLTQIKKSSILLASICGTVQTKYVCYLRR